MHASGAPACPERWPARQWAAFAFSLCAPCRPSRPTLHQDPESVGGVSLRHQVVAGAKPALAGGAARRGRLGTVAASRLEAGGPRPWRGPDQPPQAAPAWGPSPRLALQSQVFFRRASSRGALPQGARPWAQLGAPPEGRHLGGQQVERLVVQLPQQRHLAARVGGARGRRGAALGVVAPRRGVCRAPLLAAGCSALPFALEYRNATRADAPLCPVAKPSRPCLEASAQAALQAEHAAPWQPPTPASTAAPGAGPHPNTPLQACQATSLRSACGSSWKSTVSSFTSCCRTQTCGKGREGAGWGMREGGMGGWGEECVWGGGGVGFVCGGVGGAGGRGTFCLPWPYGRPLAGVQRQRCQQ